MSTNKTESDVVRVMSFNIRYGAGDDGENHWLHRRELVIQVVRDFQPDLLGTQEVLPGQLDYMAEQLSGYQVAAVGRDDGLRAGESAAIFFRDERWQCLGERHFWLSETPNVPGRIAWGASQRRIVSACRLRPRRQTKRQLWFFNTHFDHRSKTARMKSADLLRQRIDKIIIDTPVIVVGDFNATEHDAVYRSLLAGSDRPRRLIDSYRSVHPQIDGRERTEHHFTGEERGSRIDWILHSAHFTTRQAAIVRTALDGRFPSDHFPVTAALAWQR